MTLVAGFDSPPQFPAMKPGNSKGVSMKPKNQTMRGKVVVVTKPKEQAEFGDTKRDDLMDEARENAANEAFERFSDEDPPDDEDEGRWHRAPEPVEEPPYCDRCGGTHAGNCGPF